MVRNIAPFACSLNVCDSLFGFLCSGEAVAVVGVCVAAKVADFDVETTVSVVTKNSTLDFTARHVVAESVGVGKHCEAPCFVAGQSVVDELIIHPQTALVKRKSTKKNQ
jgi:hypothetical protein